MNDLAIIPFDNEDREQFAQLIGYSLSGYGSLSYVSNDSYDTAAYMETNGDNELVAENKVLKEELTELRRHVKEMAVIAFNVHPDDLG